MIVNCIVNNYLRSMILQYGSLETSWEGPFVVMEVSRVNYRITNLDGKKARVRLSSVYVCVMIKDVLSFLCMTI